MTTLYTLAHPSKEALLKLIESRRIHPRLKRKRADALLEEFGVEFKHAPRSLNIRPLLLRIRRQIQPIKSQATPADAAFALKRVRGMFDESVSPLEDPQFPVSTTTDFPHRYQPPTNTEMIL